MTMARCWGFCMRGMRRARVTRLGVEIKLRFFESPGRQHNASGGYKITSKANNWVALEYVPA